MDTPEIVTPDPAANTTVISLADAKKWIEEHPRVRFHIRFVKADGTIRGMECATGIADEILLAKNPYNKGVDFKKKGLIGVYEYPQEQYRCFDPERLLSIQIDGVWKTVIENQMKFPGFKEIS